MTEQQGQFALCSSSPLTKDWEKGMIPWRGLWRLESTMKIPIPQLTTILLLVHMAFGCCWHHAHSCAVNCCETPSARAEVCCDGHRHHGLNSAYDDRDRSDDDRRSNRHHRSESAPCDRSTPDQHQCEGDRCSYVRSGRSPVEEGQVCVLIPNLDAATTAILRGNDSFVRAGNIRQGGSAERPPLRLHLRFAVLLI